MQAVSDFMSRRQLVFAAAALIAVAAIVFAISVWRSPSRDARLAFVRASGLRFVAGGRPFRFVGANVAIMYRDEDRARIDFASVGHDRRLFEYANDR